MHCPSCRHENRPGAKFCEECATPLRLACASCGSELRPTAKFCDECGASVAGGAPGSPLVRPASARKVVTVVFADLAGSTALHERVDPESARRVMEAYYAALRDAVERHGGTVVKLLGDGVMAAFGVPHVAEDDAIRAVRAGVAMQEAFRALVAERAAVLGDVGLRVAINTGEVVVTGDDDDVVGDPVNVAARLQQEARDGDVVVGEATRRLVDALVTLEPLGSFALKGRAEAVRAHRVVSLETPAAATTAAFVGREEELERIEAVYEAAVRAPATRLAVLLASAGLGKSRLIGEFGRRRGEAGTVVVARCDAAGGATFAPLAEALRELLGIEAGASVDAARAAIEAALPRDDDGARVASGVAALLAGSPATPEETFFVVRRLLAGIAEVKPVVLVIDDLQWAEPLLLDLVEHLVQWGAGVPLLVLVGARPELRDVRSSLVAPGGLVSDVVTLSGLDAGAAMRLAANVIGAADLPAAVAAKVLATSEGNPLFIGELVRMLVEEGALTREGDRWTAGTALATLEMPPTIHALLAARIERLRPDERTVLERAAVVGRHFSRSAVAALLPGVEVDLDARLEALRRSELIERDTGWLLGEPVLRFHHVLIRDAAYRRLLKETRAELHERLADWIEDRIGDSTMVIRGAATPEQDETIGRHLEQAHQLRSELGTLGPGGKRLGNRASTRLASAGRAALARDDVSLAAGLLGRALECLEPDDAARADLALDWCEALLAAGDVTQAATAIDELGRFTSTSPRLGAWRTCFAGQLTVLTAREALRTTANEVAAAATQLAALGDAAGEATAHYVQALALARLGQVGGCEAALDRALAAARRADDRRRANTVLAIAPLAALWGPSPVTRASGRCLDVVRVLRITQGAPAVEAVALSCQGVLEALRGRTDAAKRMIAAAREMVEELGIAQRLFETDAFAGLVALIEGDGVAAERSLRGAYEGFRDLGLGIDAARAAALLGRALLAQGRGADAEALSHESEALAGDDLKAAIAWRGVRAAALARRAEHAAAAELAATAVEMAATTDALLDHADARLALAVALRAAGRDGEADAEERRAVELWEAKGATLLVERAGRRVATSDATRAGSERPDAPTVRASVAPNLAVALVARFDAAIANRDLDAVRATFRDDFEEVDHTLGSRYGVDETMASMQRLLRSRDPRYHADPLATLGPTLLLARRHSSASGATGRRYDVGAYENEVIQILEVDDQSLLVRSEVFGCDYLGDAIARLYEHHAELLPEGRERDRAAMTARLVTAMLTPTSERLEDVMAPDVQAVDHRTVDDVLALGTEGLLRRTTESGAIRATGGTFTNTSLLLSTFGPDGRQARFEMFDVGHEAEALARYDELTTRPAPPRPVRRVRPNAATHNAARIDAAAEARDADAVAAALSDDLHVIHHPTGTTHGASGLVATYRRLFRAEGLSFRHTPIATLGDSLCLLRASISHEGVALKSGGVTGPVEAEEFVLHHVDEHGRLAWAEAFGVDHLAEAVTRLYERYAEGQPGGAARDRAATSAHSMAVAAGPLDPERMATVWASTYRIVDHRVFGTWTARSGAEAQEHFRRQLDLAPDFAHRFEDVLALEPHALLVRESFHGTSRASGGTFENRICAIYHLDPDGLQAGAEAFEAEQGAEALARFEELTASQEPPSAPSRRVRPNRATVMADRAVAAINARNMQAFEEMLANDFVYVHHSTGVTFGKREQLAVFRSAFRAGHLAYRCEPLAVLGESLLLAREWFSVSGLKERVFDAFGPAEIHSVFVMEWDGEDRICRMEIFAPDHLGDAVARLYERDAELLPDGPERTRAATTARSVAAVWEMADSDRWVGSCAPTVEFADHRTLGTWSGRGPDAMRQHLAALAELADNVSFDVADVLGLRPDAVLFRWSHTGTARQGGGRYERRFLLLPVFGADGQLVRCEFFDEDRTGEALARFDELTAARESSRPPARRVRPNRATALVDGTATAINARDMPGYERTLADEFVYVHHVTGATYGKNEELAVWRAAFRAEALAFRYEPLAVLGESLVLAREWVSVVGLKERGFDAFGPAEIHDLFVAEEDGQGRMCRMEIFAPSRLGDAVVRLYERHAERRPEGPARDRAAAVARSLAIIAGPIDLERWATALAPTVRFVDHRIFGTWAASDRAEALQHFRLQLDLAPDFAHRLDDIVAVEPQSLVVRDTYYGTARESGGAFENLLCGVWAFGTDGALARADIFEAEQTAEALAYVDELTTPATAPPPLARFENDASRHGATCVRLFAAGDYDTHRRLFAEQFRYHDRRRMALLELDYDRFEAFVRYAGDGRTSRVDFRTLATRGEQLALWRAAIQVAGGDVGPSEIEFLNITELDDRGLATAYVRFDTDDLDAAYAELDRRYVVQGVDLTLGDAINRRQGDTLASFLAPTFVEYDHRRPSLLGTVQGPEDWVTGVHALTDLAPDVVIRVEHLRLHARGRLFQSTWHGTRDGGRFELPMLGVHELDEGGAVVRADLYDLDHADEASARFDEIPATPAVMSRRSTSASGTMDRIAEALAVGFETDDWRGLRTICAPGFTFEDRQSHSRVSGDVEMLIASARERLRSGARAQRSMVGLMGDRIQFGRTLWVGGPPGGEFEVEYLATSEVDEAGRLRRFVMADVDAADELRRDAWARWVAIDPSVAPHLEILGNVLRAWETQDVEACAAILTEDLIVEDRRRTGTGRSDGREAYIRSVVALWDLAPDTHLEGGWDWLATAPGISAYRARRFGRVPDGGDFESEFLVVMVHENGKTSRIEVFEADDEAGALERFEALRPDRPTLVHRSATMERAFEPIRTAWERRRLDDIRTLVAPSFRYEDRGKRALVVGDVDTWIESMRFWPAGTHARTDEIVGSFGDRIAVDHAGWSGTSDGAAFEIERLRLLEVDAEGRLSTAIHFDVDDRATAFREAERRFRAGEAAGCESQAVIAEMIRRLDAQDWDGFRESLSPDLAHCDHRVLGLGSLDRETWIASFRALADLAVELRQEVFGVLAWNHHGRVSSVLQRGIVKDGGPFENAFVVLVMAAGGVVDRVEVFDVADASLAAERLEALSGELEERGAE